MAICAYYQYIHHAFIVGGWVRKYPTTCLRSIWMIPEDLGNGFCCFISYEALFHVIVFVLECLQPCISGRSLPDHFLFILLIEEEVCQHNLQCHTVHTVSDLTNFSTIGFSTIKIHYTNFRFNIIHGFLCLPNFQAFMG